MIAAIAAALVFFTAWVWLGARPYFEAWKRHVPLSPSPADDSE